jgi:deoxyadenosine/deoxycytidine kinase
MLYPTEIMGKIVEIIGNTASGKTTLAKALFATGQFYCALEQHDERPFQSAMAIDHQRYALANQVDYLLLRAEQEQMLRNQDLPGIIDGGLEEDFYLFTRLFLRKGYLQQTEFELCERLYSTLRKNLGEPDLYIWLDVSVSISAQRFQSRHRKLEIAQVNDLYDLEVLLKEWMKSSLEVPLIKIVGQQTVESIMDTLNPIFIQEGIFRKE